MKELFIVFFFSIMSLMTVAQDLIIKHSGDTLNCKVKEVLENNLKYKFQGEDVIMTIYLSQVEKVIFSSGRVQNFTDKIIVNGKKDWPKVIVTNISEEVSGLVRKGEVIGKATGNWGAASSAKSVYNNALEKMKKEAAEKGAHIIYMKDLIVKDGDIMTGQWAKSMLRGACYGYK